jgi:hypothetical protein
MTDPTTYNSHKRLFELFKELTGEDLMEPPKKKAKEAT